MQNLIVMITLLALSFISSLQAQFFFEPDSLWTNPWDVKMSCYCNARRAKILPIFQDCEKFIDDKNLGCLPPYREGWEFSYHQNFKQLNSGWSPLTHFKFPEVYKNLLITDQILDLVRDYQYEWNIKLIEAGRESRQEKDAMISNKNTYLMQKYFLCKKKLADCKLKIMNEYVKLFEKCLKRHSNLATYHDYGLLAYTCNNFNKSIEMLTKFVEGAKTTGALKELTSSMYNQLGEVCIESMKYEEAIEYLTEAIDKDPTNKTLYFHRSLAYFEIGDFDRAIKDYVDADYSKNIPDAIYETSTLWERYKEQDTSIEFKLALFQSLAKGSADSAIDFVPSLLNSVYGLAEALWVNVYNFDVNNLKIDRMAHSACCFANSCNEMGENFKNFRHEISFNHCIEQVKTLYSRYDNLSDKERGELIGYTIGRYGVDALGPGATLKGIALYKNLKNANRMCNLDALVSSCSNEKLMREVILKRFAERRAYFDRVRLSVDKQNKHKLGHNNYKAGNSIFDHPDPERLFHEFKGKGVPVKNGHLGDYGADFKEAIDFNEHIGIWIHSPSKIELPTTKGTIHYSKKNGHIIPADPRGIYE